jgi:carbon starvation protein CstA
MSLLVRRILSGLALGVTARIWMRLISDDPEFSLGGSVVVVGVFVLFSLGTGVCLMMSAGSRMSNRFGRAVGLLFMLPLFGAAGAQMMPTVILGSFLLHRTSWKVWIRVLFGLLALVLPVGIIVESLNDNLSVWRVLGLFMFAATYFAVVVMTAPIFGTRRTGSTSDSCSAGH